MDESFFFFMQFNLPSETGARLRGLPNPSLKVYKSPKEAGDSHT